MLDFIGGAIFAIHAATSTGAHAVQRAPHLVEDPVPTAVLLVEQAVAVGDSITVCSSRVDLGLKLSQRRGRKVCRLAVRELDHRDG
ncbi:MAG TPA: hypothetical protein VFK02_10945 [Kofleriaceae bacterium]|nr:hypothetical protein [Kofleriaceae bacterium]